MRLIQIEVINMTISDTITLGSVTIGGGLNTTQAINAGKRPGTKKQLFNQSYNETVIPGRNKEWVIPISGMLTGTDKDTDRATLQGYHDDSVPRAYSDGIRDVDVIILPGSLVFIDKAPALDAYAYTMTLVEYNQ